MALIVLILASSIMFVAAISYIAQGVKGIKIAVNPLEKIGYKINLSLRISQSLAVLAVANFIDIGARFPFFVIGPTSAGLSLLLLILSACFLVYYLSPKKKEVLEAASHTKGLLMLNILTLKLQMSVGHARRTLEELFDDDMVFFLNTDKRAFADSIFMVRGYSGQTERPASTASAGETQEDRDNDTRRQHQDLINRSPREVSQMISRGVLDLGQSGQPL